MPRLKRIDLTFGAMKKDELLKAIKEELDKEIHTDMVSDTVITVTSEGQGVTPPPKK